MIKIEPVWHLAPQPVVGIIILGAGGTGSYLIGHLVRDLYTMEPTKRPQLMLCDGDKVEVKNIKRQHFAPSDVNKNKALALAERYSAAFGLQISCKDSYLESEEQLADILKGINGAVIVATCVDNVKTRWLVKQAVDKHTKPVYWIDCGNEEKTGQVVLGAKVPSWRQVQLADDHIFPTPDVFEAYPELIEKAKADKLPTELSCAELAAASPQFGFVNLNAATPALNFIHMLIHGEPIHTHMMNFSIDNYFSHKVFKESYIRSWEKTCNKYNGFGETADKFGLFKPAVDIKTRLQELLKR